MMAVKVSGRTFAETLLLRCEPRDERLIVFEIS
jgi:hypothetical protein